MRAAQRLVLVRAQAFLRVALSQFSPRLYIGSRFLWYSFILLVRRVSDGVTGSVCDHVGYNSGTVLVSSYALTGPAALYAPEKRCGITDHDDAQMFTNNGRELSALAKAIREQTPNVENRVQSMSGGEVLCTALIPHCLAPRWG